MREIPSGRRRPLLAVVLAGGMVVGAAGRAGAAPPAGLPDLRFECFRIGGAGRLAVDLRNVGEGALPPEATIRVQVQVDGVRVVDRDLAPAERGVLEPAGGSLLVEVPGARPRGRYQVAARVDPEDRIAEFTEFDNVLSRTVRLTGPPPGSRPATDATTRAPSFRAYEELINHPRIREAIAWEGTSGVLPVKRWPGYMKRDLAARIGRLEVGRPLDEGAPPLPDAAGLLTPEDAWRVYVSNLAVSLWVERNRKVPWRLTAKSPEHLRVLLDAREFFDLDAGARGYRIDKERVGNATPWDPAALHRFLEFTGAIRETPAATVYALTDWMRGHLVHARKGEGKGRLYGAPGPPRADLLFYPPRAPKHVTRGCRGTVGLYRAALRTVNIAVVAHGFLWESAGQSHSRPEFPEPGLHLQHGDTPYETPARPGGSAIPVEELFLDDTAADRWWTRKVTRRGVGDVWGPEADRFERRRLSDLLVEHLPDHFLLAVARASRPGGRAARLPKVFREAGYSEARLGEIRARVRDRLSALGGGDPEVGYRRVARRAARAREYLLSSPKVCDG